MLKKLLLAAAALFFILAGSLMLLMGYVFNNPGTVFNAFNSVADRFLQGQTHEENEEFFLQGMDEILISSRTVDVDLRTYSGSTLKIRLSGKVPRFEEGRYIQQTAEQSRLHLELLEPLASHWIQMNVNGQELSKSTDSHLKAEVYVPETFKKQIRIETREGHVTLRLPPTILYELDLQSISGPIDNSLKQEPVAGVEPTEVGRIQVQTVEGPITVESALE